MKVADIFNFLNTLYPCETACDFDNVGLLVGDEQAEVSKALICLDCTVAALKKAIEEKCQLIITHHPIIFSPIKKLTSGDIRFELIKNGISVISMHTNMDIADSGVTDFLCKIIGLENIETFTASDGFLLRKGETPPLLPNDFALQIKGKLGGSVKFNDSDKKISKVLVCSGSGGDFTEDVIASGCDALVTSEIKHHQFLKATELEISVFDAGHFNTEDIIVEPLKDILQKEFSDIEFLTDHTSTIKSV